MSLLEKKDVQYEWMRWKKQKEKEEVQHKDFLGGHLC